MRPKVLVDTDILSGVTKARNPVVVTHARQHLSERGRLTFSAISVMEVVSGYSQTRSEEKLRRFLEMVARSDVIPFDTTTADLAGRIHADLRRAGTSIGVPDTAIAATAVQHGVPLVTGNTDDYDRIRDAGYPLVLLNWREA